MLIFDLPRIILHGCQIKQPHMRPNLFQKYLTEYLTELSWVVFYDPTLSMVFLFILHTKHTQNLFKMQKVSKAFFEFIDTPMEKRLINNIINNINQYYSESIRLKQRWQKRRIGMFSKTIKANKVVIKAKAFIAVLKCYVFQCFSIITANQIPSCCVIISNFSFLLK